MYGKQSNAVKVRSGRAHEPVYSDTCGPFLVTDVDGNVYFQTYMDDITRLTVTFVMEKRRKHYLYFMNNKGNEFQNLKTDQGTEYRSNEITEHVRACGVTYVLTGRAAHAQIHVAERIKSTVTDMSQTMRLYVGLSKCWWGYAILYLTMIRIRCTTSIFTNKETTYQRFFHNNADLKSFKRFGCTALIYVSISKTTKLDSTAERGTLVSISEGTLHYRIYFHSTKHIGQARDVTFIADDNVQFVVDDLNTFILEETIVHNLREAPGMKAPAGRDEVRR